MSRRVGMKYSLISRDYIADCIEVMHEGYMADAIITIGGCDKTVPAAVSVCAGNPGEITLMTKNDYVR